MYKLFFSLLIILALLLGGCKKSTLTTQSTDAFAESVDTESKKDIINEFIFLGESTTYHLKSRGVLVGGNQTTQVWAPKSGTLMLDTSTAFCRIVYPETSEELELSEALSRKKPKFILLTFGLNGATKSISKGSEYFKSCYSKLINTIHSASPDTVVILQSCFPIGKGMDMSAHSVDAETLNSYIDTINEWSAELASKLSLSYINTSPTLKGSDGFLKPEYHTEDGYHLTKDAYVEILNYIRTYMQGE